MTTTPRAMKPTEFRNAMTSLRWLVDDAARALGVHRNTISRYLNGHTAIPLATAALVRSMRDGARKRA